MQAAGGSLPEMASSAVERSAVLLMNLLSDREAAFKRNAIVQGRTNVLP